PHQLLVTIDDRLGGDAVLVEPGGGHRVFELSDRLLDLGNLRLETLDDGAAGLLGALTPPGVGVRAFPVFTRRRVVGRCSGHAWTVGAGVLRALLRRAGTRDAALTLRPLRRGSPRRLPAPAG